MHSTLNPKTDPQRVLVARVDEELAHTYEQIAQADEQIARAEEQLSKLEQDVARYPSDHPQTRTNTLRPAVLGNRPSPGGRAIRGFIGLLLAACIGVAAFVSQSSYGDAARQIVARWAPQLVSTSSLPLANPGRSAQPDPPTARVVAAQTASPQAAPPAQTASQGVAPTVAPVSSELAQLLQTMARDLANVEQGIEQLKASQEQIVRDNAKTVEQLKASQEQMTRLIAKASEQNLRPKTSAPPPRPIATPTRKLVPRLPSQQTRERAQAPVQLKPED
jgi:septal ring factor EnvC (AmiA/AmiB activator)